MLAFWRSAIGKKAVMAVTGLIMVLFLVFHVTANLLVFGGPHALNAFAHVFDHTVVLLTWIARVVLVASVGLHILAAIQLTLMDWKARPVGYRKRRRWRDSTWSSRTMRWTGVAIALFVAFHVLHLDAGTIRPVPVDPRQNLYAAVVGGFQVSWVVIIYLVGLALLGLHLVHGAWAWLRSTGAAPPRAQPLSRPLALIVAVFIWAGFTTIVVVAVTGGFPLK